MSKIIIKQINAECAALSDVSRRSAREAETAAWRAIVRSELGDTLLYYNTLGAPCVEGSYISVSHGGGYVGVAFDEEPCGLDIERADREFAKVYDKYASEAEKQFDAGSVWCAKEAVYKLFGQRGRDLVNLKNDIRVKSFDVSTGIMTVTADGECRRVRIVRRGGLIIAVTGAEPLLAFELTDLEG